MPAILNPTISSAKTSMPHIRTSSANRLTRKMRSCWATKAPNPLFYLVLSPSMKQFFGLGSAMHHDAPSKLIAALKESLQVLEEHELPVGRAYALGFLCHYSLDRAMHPLVYCQQYAICDAGIDGLNRSQENEVHAEIEREYDEMVLFSKLGRTIRSYRPFEEALHASRAHSANHWENATPSSR